MSSTLRLRLDLAYDGTAFRGWARQPSLRTVQEVLEQALDTVLRTEGTRVTVAGRTDTGVHARGQVAHLDVDPEALVVAAGRTPGPVTDVLARRVNGVLDPDVRVRRISEAPPGFDARFSAVWRRYAYRIVDRPDLVDPLTRSHVLAHPRPLDVAALNEASRALLGVHDFASFCKKRPGATTIRTLLDLGWAREAGVVEATVRADAFCHNMVRSLIGCLIAVGDGRREPTWAVDVLTGRSRHPAVTVVSARGLTLEEVGYPADDGLAAQAEASRAVRTLEA